MDFVYVARLNKQWEGKASPAVGAATFRVV